METIGIVDYVQSAVDYALSGESRLPREVLEIEGLTGLHIRNLLNRICQTPMPAVRYLEVGLWKGASFTSAMYDNAGTFVGIDNFALDHTPKNATKEQIIKQVKDQMRKYGNGQATLIERDCFAVKVRDLLPYGPFDIFYYDGSHLKVCQEMALTHFYSVLANECIYMCDDWNSEEVREGTRAGLKKIPFQVLKEWEFFTHRRGITASWWNGFYVCALRWDL